MWELKTVRDIGCGRIFVIQGDYHASARKVATLPVMNGDSMIFSARALWGHPAGDEESVTLTLDTPVYILTCNCNGMSFSCNRWMFTGRCSCVHVPLPKES